MYRQHEERLLVDFSCAATGGPANYVGRDMKMSHAGLGISESDWNVLMRHTAATLEDLGVAQKEKDEFLSLVATLKSDIVEVPQVSRTGA
jgi:hemoglobin